MKANSTIIEKTFVALDYISINYPDTYERFNREVLNVNILALHIETRQFITIMHLYGYSFLIALEKFFIAAEEFENCIAMRRQVEVWNYLTNDNIKIK